VAAFGAALGLVGWLAPFLGEYPLRVTIVMGITVIMVASMALSNGFTGVFSLGHVGFIALGAYTSAILTLPVTAKHAYLRDLPTFLAGWSLPFLPATLAAGVLCTVVAILVGLPLMRLSGHYVSVATLGLLVIVNVVLVNADRFTRGSRTFTGVLPDTTIWWVLGWLAVTYVVLSRVAYSPFGRAMRVSREDLVTAEAVGIDVLPTRLIAFAVSAFFSGVAGALYAHYLTSFSPAAFYFALMIHLLVMLVVGGMGSLTGAGVGVVVITLLSEVLRNLERGFHLGALAVPPLYGASQITLGVVFILIMIFRPQGLLGQHELVLVPRSRPVRTAGTSARQDLEEREVQA
jgi:branched-chain amino acid transport system permease protein